MHSLAWTPARHDLMQAMANSAATVTATNKLCYGDNLHVLREHVADESVDLIYLDPPFNSKRDYNLLFKTPKGFDSDASITAFDDSWHWTQQADDEIKEIVNPTPELMRLRSSDCAGRVFNSRFSR